MTILEAAQALADDLVAHTFSVLLPAEVRWAPQFTIDELTTARRVTVRPAALRRTDYTRTGPLDEFDIDVAVHHYVPTEAEVSTEIGIMDEIIGFVWHRRLTEYPNVIATAVTCEPLYDAARLRETKVFVSVVTITFQVLP